VAFVHRYLKFWTMDKNHKPSDSEFLTPSSEPFRFDFCVTCIWQLFVVNCVPMCVIKLK
jgi:hypothetical protein